MQDLFKMVHGGVISRPKLEVLRVSKHGDRECYPSPADEDDDMHEYDETKIGEQVAGCLQRIQEAVKIVYKKEYPMESNIVRVLEVDGTCQTEDELWKMGVTSPFGDIVAHKTRVDKNARDARELPSTSKVTGFLDNPFDPMWVDLQKMVQAKWSRSSNFFLRFKKANMYRKGNGFTRHVDTPKAGLVGTVVLFGWGCADDWGGDDWGGDGRGGDGRGGDLVVHGEHIPVNLTMTMVVFSSAAPHRVEPIEDGTRVSLVWELFLGAHPEDAVPLWPSKSSHKDVDIPAALLKLKKKRTEKVAEEARTLRKIPTAYQVLMLPLNEAYTSDTICQAIRKSTGCTVDLQESLIGRDKTVAQPFLDDKNLVCSVSPVVIVCTQVESDGFNYQVESYKEHDVNLICASSMFYQRNSVFQRLVSCGERVKWVFPAWHSVQQWTQGFLVLGCAHEGLCGLYGNAIEQVASIDNQVYFRLVLCVMHKSSALLAEL